MAGLRKACLWQETAQIQVDVECLQGTLKTDVCIIGGGITGLSCALRLLEQGRRLVLLESADFGAGGSGRNVGLVNAGTWVTPDAVEKTLGTAVGRKLNAALGAAPELVFQVIERYGIACEAERRGTLHMAHNASGISELASRCQQWQQRGAPVELLTGARCQAYSGSQQILAALLDHRAGTINPMAYTLGLAAAVARLGGALYRGSPVKALVREAGGWQVRTPGGVVQADKVVIATGAYAEGDWPGAQRNYFRGYYYDVASQPLAGPAAEAVLPHAKGAWDTRTVLSSIRRDADGRLILGSLGRMDDKPSWFVRRWAERIQQHYFPQLGRVAWDTHWTGCIDFTPDHLIRLTEPAPGLLSANGYNGRGNTTGTLIGRAFADYLMHDERGALPLPFSSYQVLRSGTLRGLAYEAGFTLYHAGQCLRVIL